MRIKQKTFRKPRDLAAYLKRSLLFRTTFIAVTGSCGKSSTTHFIDHLLKQKIKGRMGFHWNARRHAIQNILNTQLSDRYLVQEVSGQEPGAINAVASIFRPRIGIITTVGQDHYTNFRSLEQTALEKGTLAESLPSDGTAILNADDPHVLAMANRTQATVLTFGTGNQAQVRAMDVSSVWPERLSMTIHYQGKSVQLNTRLFGEIWVTSVLAAITCGLAMELDLESCVEGLNGITPPPGRMTVYETPQDTSFITDTLKAPYWTVEQVVKSLVNAKASRKTVIIGSISDTPGAVSPKYRKIARMCLEVADRVFFVGPNAHFVDKLLSEYQPDRLLSFSSVLDAHNHLKQDLIPGEVVLRKANRLEHMERLAHAHSMQVSCWKKRCDERLDCGTCKFREIISEEKKTPEFTG